MICGTGLRRFAFVVRRRCDDLLADARFFMRRGDGLTLGLCRFFVRGRCRCAAFRFFAPRLALRERFSAAF
jgi:hypothetical protein